MRTKISYGTNIPGRNESVEEENDYDYSEVISETTVIPNEKVRITFLE